MEFISLLYLGVLSVEKEGRSNRESRAWKSDNLKEAETGLKKKMCFCFDGFSFNVDHNNSES